ncbi:MAG TPA: hypothetical protein VGM11_06475 [Acidobacteriaceae bacterium]|jgi:hypothetical protein
MELHPLEGVHSWKQFLVHMGIVVVGILIAIGLEQTVEDIHHREQRQQLRADLREDIRSNVEKEEFDLKRGAVMRGYLLELRNAVDAQRKGQRTAALPGRPDVALVHPLMAAWAAAKESGEVALLPASEIRLYDRLLFQVGRMDMEIEAFHTSSQELESFEQRFVDGPGGFDFGALKDAPDITRMSAEDLEEYSKLLSAEITAVDRVTRRVRSVYAEDRALKEGATTEEELVRSAQKMMDTR